TPVRRATRLGGGSINDAFSVLFEDGTELFIKTNATPPAGMFEAEARGLRWLEEAKSIRIPSVVALSDMPPAYLALELLTPGKRSASFDETLGQSLAALHAVGAPSFGLDHDNFIGRLPQSNRVADDWAAFYWNSRLEPQLRMACDRGLVDAGTQASFGALERVLGDRVGAQEPPSRLHGDLWGGNLHADATGAPALIDPAVYGGHREIDLAMMRLFGGFGERVFAAYDEAWPLGPGASQRVSLYQLYPLLVHVNLFGGSYLGSVRRALSECL
ncbi:MAG: fructosamine kinase family protein, partial [Polyangiales bacterium]